MPCKGRLLIAGMAQSMILFRAGRVAGSPLIIPVSARFPDRMPALSLFYSPTPRVNRGQPPAVPPLQTPDGGQNSRFWLIDPAAPTEQRGNRAVCALPFLVHEHHR
jgi:hypothetical protein